MEERINKPRVFLSHSKKNVDFIENLANDLRKCQIEPWLDTDQIRHGKSWQDSIFEYGLPTCDAIIVYFTEISIQSPIVKKEMDVGLLKNIKDNNIAFLPYVSDEKLRSQLRPDIQALQVPEWNENNYTALLPRVVAEIWRSYLERMIEFTSKDERLKRVQLELELEKRNNQDVGVFSLSESKEFEFIHQSFNKTLDISVPLQLVGTGSSKILTQLYDFRVDLSSVVSSLPNGNTNEYVHLKFLNLLLDRCVTLVDEQLDDSQTVTVSYDVKIAGIPDILEDLRMFGLVRGVPVGNVRTSSLEDPLVYMNVFTEKLFRYRYWLAYNGNLSQEISIELI